MTPRAWSEADVRALGVTCDVVTAGSVLGIGRAAAYQLAARDQLGVPVLHLGSRLRVPVAGLLVALGLPLTPIPDSEAGSPTPPAVALTATDQGAPTPHAEDHSRVAHLQRLRAG